MKDTPARRSVFSRVTSSCRFQPGWTGRVQAVKACWSMSSVNTSEGFFQWWIFVQPRGTQIAQSGWCWSGVWSKLASLRTQSGSKSTYTSSPACSMACLIAKSHWTWSWASDRSWLCRSAVRAEKAAR